jgi:hypothetical protein
MRYIVSRVAEMRNGQLWFLSLLNPLASDSRWWTAGQAGYPRIAEMRRYPIVGDPLVLLLTRSKRKCRTPL